MAWRARRTVSSVARSPGSNASAKRARAAPLSRHRAERGGEGGGGFGERRAGSPLGRAGERGGGPSERRRCVLRAVGGRRRLRSAPASGRAVRRRPGSAPAWAPGSRERSRRASSFPQPPAALRAAAPAPPPPAGRGRARSMVLGVVSGRRIRSRKVAAASVVGSRRFSGLLSKRSSGRQAQRGHRHQPPPTSSAAPRAAREQAVERRERGIAHRIALRPRAGEQQQGGQGGQADDHGDDHARRGDQPELRHAAVARRIEGQEAGAERQRRQRDGLRPRLRAAATSAGARGWPARRCRCSRRRHRVLDAEIDAEADEHHGEGDGERVERPDREQAEGGGHRQPEHQHDEVRAGSAASSAARARAAARPRAATGCSRRSRRRTRWRTPRRPSPARR